MNTPLNDPPFCASLDEPAGAVLLDVRRRAAFDQATTLIPGAQWRDPADVGRWARTLPRGQAVIVYCVHGHEVSQATAQYLRDAGIDARYLRGGIEAWTAAGRPLQAKAGG